MRLRPALLIPPAVALAGCGGSGGTPPAPVVPPTRGIEHLRIVQRVGAERTVLESWEHRPADGCWSTRFRGRGGLGGPLDALSTVVRDEDGVLRRVGRVDGPVEEQPGDPCAGAPRTGLQVIREIVASGALRPEGGTTVRGRTVAILTGPPDAVLLGMADPSRSTVVAEVTTRPAGARMRVLWDAARRVPVRITTPQAVVRLRGDDAVPQPVPAMRQDYLVAEEVPATPEAMRIFTPPAA
jgi:hypothetical protein